MFLTGPFFFLERDGRAGAGTTYAAAPDEAVGGVPCEQVLVRLRPGFGLSAEDRVLVSVGKSDGLLRRGALLARRLLGDPGGRRRRDLRRLDLPGRAAVADHLPGDGGVPARPRRPRLGADQPLGAADGVGLSRPGGGPGRGS